MPILRLNAGPVGLTLHRSPAPALPAIKTATAGDGPIIIMIHGFKYDPGGTSCSPHSTIFALSPDAPPRTQWMQHMGFGAGQPDEGLAIAFGWHARGSLWRAQQAARLSGRYLAQVIAIVRACAPHRPVHVVTHSMGSEVVFEALHILPARSVDRIVTLAGASYASRAVAAMQTQAGRTAELINVTSRENDLFDFIFERMIVPPLPGDWAMGGGIDLHNAVTLQLDCQYTMGVLQRFGGHIAAPERRICHWSCYTRPGALPFYAHALRRPEAVSLSALQKTLPASTAPRWSRMFARAPLNLLLPIAQKAAS